MKMRFIVPEKKKKKKIQCGHMVDQDVMKGPNPTEESRKPSVDKESKFARVKRMLTCHNRTPATYDEAKANCKARKRKERQESVSSISQERKVIRSNSEERPITNGTEKDIRRVSSHEDFQKPREHDAAVPHHHHHHHHHHQHQHQNIDEGIPREINVDVFIYDECEYERRRSHERFSKPLTHHRSKYAGQGRRPRTKHFAKSSHKDNKLEAPKENAGRKTSPRRYADGGGGDLKRENNGEKVEADEVACNFLQLRANEEKERSPSPVHTPASPPLDLSTLHEQIDCSEPIPSSSSRLICENTETMPSLSVASNRLLSSPRNSVIVTQRIYLNPEVPQNNTSMGKEERNPKEERYRHLSKQINSVKKKMKKYDEDFESRFGYRPSHADKLNDKAMKKMCSDLSRMKKEQKQLKEDSASGAVFFVAAAVAADDATEQQAEERTKKNGGCSLQDTLIEIENRLSAKRLTAERAENIEQMNNEELTEEKVAVQKALLYLESMHGRPTSKEDRDLVRPIYDRYRTLKRMVRITTPNSNVIELATILEHETMDFVSLPTQNPDTESERQNQTTGGTSTDSDTDTSSSIGENLHVLGLEELVEEQRKTGEEKKELRRSLKQFEDDFQTKSGRKLQKEDRAPMEDVYVEYKKAKAKLRLLDALVGKRAP